MNTEQAFELLTDAGVSEEKSILTVRRWLRERKIKYEGTGQRKTNYILNDTNQALTMLKDAGVDERKGIEVVQRWLLEGKVQNVGSGPRSTESNPRAKASKWSLDIPQDQERIIRQLNIKIKAQDEQINGIEQLHKTSINTLIKQRDKLNKEIDNLVNENIDLQRETKKLLQENLNLRNELIKFKEELSKGTKRESEQYQGNPVPPISNNYRQKLGLSKNATQKDVLAGYKKLLKITHPDQGGNAAAFHYIKTEYDYFRSNTKES
ncbi:hypothetical protein ABES02_22925 [Neobacillus pocheonensis]|uniref:hypothetical protein n=1 Tax=Neobacillus pocheonensis TaxID=363869 RepID=UPI003D2CAFCA